MEMSNYPLLVLVDDEQEILDAIKRCLMRIDVNIEAFSSPRLALEFIKNNQPDMVISDQRMPDITGIEVLQAVKDYWPNCKRIMLSAFQEFDVVLEGFNNGVIDQFIAKPWKNIELQYLVQGVKSNELAAIVNAETPVKIIGKHAKMVELMDHIAKAAGANVPIFIHGETGTGKELVANACHQLGCKRNGEFIAVNCANFSEHLIESQLFGHKKGAFTGAIADQKGVFEHANGGTVFLDEITTLPLNIQAKLLRVIQERTFSPVGSHENKSFDVQIVSASSTSLAQGVKEGSFREDLYYRLSVIPINIPALKERGSDIELLAKHFLAKFSQQYKKSFTGFEPKTLEFIANYSWPGNVRQLENVLHGLTVLNDGDNVSLDMLMPLINDVEEPVSVEKSLYLDNSKLNSESEIQSILPLHEIEKRAIEQALVECEGNVNKAAAILEVNPSTLYRKIKQWS